MAYGTELELSYFMSDHYRIFLVTRQSYVGISDFFLLVCDNFPEISGKGQVKFLSVLPFPVRNRFILFYFYISVSQTSLIHITISNYFLTILRFKSFSSFLGTFFLVANQLH